MNKIEIKMNKSLMRSIEGNDEKWERGCCSFIMLYVRKLKALIKMFSCAYFVEIHRARRRSILFTTIWLLLSSIIEIR